MQDFISTAQSRPDGRFRFWQEAVCDVFVELDCRALSDRTFRGEIGTVRSGEVRLSTVAASEHHVVRTRERIRRAREEVLLLSLQIAGEGVVRQDGRDAQLRPGDFALYDSTRPYELHFGAAFSQLVVHVPRVLLAPRLGDTRLVSARRVAYEAGGLGALASDFLRRLPGVVATSDTLAAARLSDMALELVAAGLAPHAPQDPGRTPDTLVRGAKALITQRLADPELSTRGVAHALGVSARYLQVLFQREGTTVRAWILRERLNRVRDALGQPAAAPRSVTDLAFSWGFNDLAYFSRRFKEAFGVTASELRQRAGEEAAKKPRKDRPASHR